MYFVVLVLELVFLRFFGVTFAFRGLAGLRVAASVGKDVNLDLFLFGLRVLVDIHAVWVRPGLGMGLVFV